MFLRSGSLLTGLDISHRAREVVPTPHLRTYTRLYFVSLFTALERRYTKRLDNYGRSFFLAEI